MVNYHCDAIGLKRDHGKAFSESTISLGRADMEDLTGTNFTLPDPLPADSV